MNILLIEDHPGDSRLIQESLKAADIAFDLTVSGNLANGLIHLGAQSTDIILLELSLPDSSRLDSFHQIIAGRIRSEAKVRCP